MNNTARTVSYAAAALLAMLLGAWLGLTRNKPPAPPETATVYSSPRPFPDIELIDHRDSPFGVAQLKGQWSWLFFGFTHCPDICPATLQILKQAKAALPESFPTPRVVLVSVDPARDTPQILARYVAHFDPDFVGVTGSDEAITALAEALFVSYARVPLENGTYTMDHSAAVYFLDPDANIVAVSTPPHSSRHLASDLIAVGRQ